MDVAVAEWRTFAPGGIKKCGKVAPASPRYSATVLADDRRGGCQNCDYS